MLVARLMLSAALVMCACSDDSPGATDESPGRPDDPDDADAGYQDCGDGLVTGTEQCDDDNASDDDECNSDCTLACGDGRVNAAETCDVAIAAGEPGACPTACVAPDACTTATLSGDNCRAECLTAAIVELENGDGCCPPGGNNNLDSDCVPVCGNGALETGELCDTAIAAGAGSCPVQVDCVDGLACTRDQLAMAGTCVAVCQNPVITDEVDGDGCCPAGGTIEDDDDCIGVCGDGTVTAPELCDTAIPTGNPGACPTAADCGDGNACTTDALVSGGTCNAACTNTPITVPGADDDCCPALGNANNDPDCPAECGNSIPEPGEGCDDGGTEPGDGCDASCALEPTAFRVTTLELRDPHAFATVLIFCTDVTPQLNNAVRDTIEGDDDGDGMLDLNAVNLFRPFDSGAATTPLEVHFTDQCTAPVETTMCSLDDAPDVEPILSTANNQANGTCLAPIPGTTRPYTPGVTSATAPCFASDAEMLTIDVGGGLVIELSDAQVAGTYFGNAPDRRILNGLISGFISEDEANSTILPADLPIVGGRSLASLLRGGDGNCQSGSDMDTGPGGVPGWYFYLNFTADQVPWSEPAP